MKYQNPWANEPGFIDLGNFITNKNGSITHYDLYALISTKKDISFGARYSSEEPHYISGTAYRVFTGEWQLYVCDITAIAAARFFANHHPDIDPK